MDGSEIRDLRIRLGLTQKALAHTLGVSANSVARWERGQLGISPAMTDRLLAAAASLPSGAAITRTSGVVLDPHHRAIIDGLNAHLDPEVFEKCAVCLLDPIWPGITPVRGGRDDGFDGAVPNEHSKEPFPLIATTGTNLLKNLKTSLDSATRAGWKPQQALFATSRRITPAIRRKLFKAAREKGVNLVQTLDQDWFADRLYREPEWCKRLLGVTGRPHALSVFPVTRRPVLGDQVLGREREIQWFREPRGDCLLIGEPGSGKTFLLRALALQGGALFLVDEDREQIANDLRSLKPEAVIVDDAHVCPEIIGKLDQLRREVHAHFRIIATCWPGEADTVRSNLKMDLSDTLMLERIDADTMIEIIKSVGIHGPDELLLSIRTQAAGRPGLATTLAHLCIVGGVRTATSGDGLVDSIAPDLDRVLGLDSMRLLAPFALGGDAGASQEEVAERLGIPLLKISTSLSKLAAAGVIRERGDLAISVEPTPMRWALVRRIFFGGPGSLPVDQFLPAVRSRTNSLETLIGAHAWGADVPNLERLLDEAKSERLWGMYASVGPETARYALVRHPEIIADLAAPALAHIPEKAIPLLLSQVADECQTGVIPDSMLHPLERWIKAGNSRGWGEILDRRQTLLRCTEAWWRQTQNARVSLAAISVALEPDFDFASFDPGTGTRMTFTKATLGAGVIEPLATLWPSAMAVLSDAVDIPWTNLLNLLGAWCHSRLGNDDETRNAANRFLSRMLNDVASASLHYPGIQHRIAEFAKGAEVAVDTTLDPEFECLYPPDPYNSDDLERAHTRLAEGAQEMARRWSNRPAVDTAKFLGRLEIEARRAGINWPRLTPEFCRTLAKQHPDPAVALKVFIQERLPADLVDPCLRESVKTGKDVWPIVSDCFDDELYVAMAVQLTIGHEHAPPEMVTSALAKVGDPPRLIEHCCACGEVSRTALTRMFRSSDVSTAVSAAIGHWMATRHSRTDIPLDEAWRRAFLRSSGIRLSSTDSHWTGKILATDAELAVKWLIRFFDSGQSSFGYHAGETATKVISNLHSAQRIHILNAIRPPNRIIGTPKIICALVGNDTEIYGHLLGLDGLKYYHLSPLLGQADGDWKNLAIQALEHGYSVHDVVGTNLFGGERSWSGEYSDMWAGLRINYEALANDNDPRIATLGQLGVKETGKLEQKAKKEEREEAVHGVS